MHIKSKQGLDRSLNNYRSKYIHHLNYWTNFRRTNFWIIFENPLFNSIDLIGEYQFHSNLTFAEEISSPTESTDSGIHITMERLFNTDEDRQLPSGWERCEDEHGVYYWHKRTGTVTRNRPDFAINSPSLMTPSPSTDTGFEINSLLYKSDSDNSIRTIDDHYSQHRFYVRSFGWTTIDEEDLLNGKSSRTVNRCIYELTHHQNDSRSLWGEGKDLYMDIHHTEISFIDPTAMNIVYQQSIPAIRIWGVGRENPKDFAFVAKDKDRSIKTYKCHVFRCENTSARIIADLLKDICRNLMIERGLLNPSNHSSSNFIPKEQRPSSFPNSVESDVTKISFPTPIEEPTKHLVCEYLGCIYVDKPSGIDILRTAIEKVSKSVPKERWIPVTVNISPTSILIYSDDESKEQLLDCRIRYLSFLGVGQDLSFCGIIVHCADNSFKCHVFHCQQSSIDLCKNIEAACKLRYQKCLDAHPPMPKSITPSKSYSAQLKNLVESFWWGKN